MQQQLEHRHNMHSRENSQQPELETTQEEQATDEQEAELAIAENSELSKAEIAHLVYISVEHFALNITCNTEFLTFEQAYEHVCLTNNSFK